MTVQRFNLTRRRNITYALLINDFLVVIRRSTIDDDQSNFEFSNREILKL